MGLAASAVVRCSIPDPQLLQLSTQALAARNEVFLDTSAMATWVLLDLGNDAAQWPWRLVTTASCLQVLRSFTKEMRDPREIGGLGVSEGSVSITPRDKNVAHELAQRAERLALVLTIVDSRSLAAMQAERRDRLTELFGQWGAEAIACGAEPNRVLWTDDMLLAGVAAQMGALPTSTQAVLSAAVARRVTSAARELEIGTSLFLYNYEPLNAPDELIRHIVSSSCWQTAVPPLARLVEKLAGVGAQDWLRVARIVLAEAMLNLELPQSRSATVVAVLETLRERRDRHALLQAVVQSARGMFSLNVMREAEFLDIVQSWRGRSL
jgi:hypothetical protein